MIPSSVSRLRAACVATTLLMVFTSTPTLAQMGGMGGMGGVGGPPGGGRPGGGGREGGGGKAGTPQEQPTLDDLMAPDPWRIWLEKLQLDVPRLALTPEQRPLFDDFVRELDLARQSNTQRVNGVLRRRPNSVSALVDIGRDLRKQSEEAQDWVSALGDLSQRWEALRAVLNPQQQALVNESYRAASAVGPAGARR